MIINNVDLAIDLPSIFYHKDSNTRIFTPATTLCPSTSHTTAATTPLPSSSNGPSSETATSEPAAA